jgi:hypothetical protein
MGASSSCVFGFFLSMAPFSASAKSSGVNPRLSARRWTIVAGLASLNSGGTRPSKGVPLNLQW